MNKINATFYYCSKNVNDLMMQCDLSNSGKYYFTPMAISFTTESEIDEEYFLKIINTSFDSEKNTSDSFVAAIDHNGIIYSHKSVKELSSGKESMYFN